MPNEHLNTILSATLSKKRVADLVLMEKSRLLDIHELYAYSFHPRQTIAFRASWILETIALDDPAQFLPVAGKFLSDFPKQKNLSCQRHFTKILMCFQEKTAPPLLQEALARADREALVSTTFDWLMDPDTPLAVLANCMDILYDFSEEFDWVEEALTYQLTQLMDRGSPALNSRGKRVFQKINRKSSRRTSK